MLTAEYESRLYRAARADGDAHPAALEKSRRGAQAGRRGRGLGMTVHRRIHRTHRQDRTAGRDGCSVCGLEADVVVIDSDGVPQLRIALCESHGGSLLATLRDELMAA